MTSVHRVVGKPAAPVEALLTGGDRFTVELPLYFLWRKHPAELERFFPRGKLQPQGLWIRKRT
jgi:hypothetical protein